MYRHVTAAGFVPGVPARDLTDDEAEAYGVTDSPAYVFVAAAEAADESAADAATRGGRGKKEPAREARASVTADEEDGNG